MRRSWLTIALAILAGALLVLLVLCARCGREHAPAGKARLEIGQLGLSIWDDGTIALAIPIENRGDRGAGNVRVTALSLDAGARIEPANLPIALGEVVPRRRAVVQARFAGLAVPGNPVLTIAGTYLEGNTTSRFTASLPVALRPPRTGPVTSRPIAIPKQHTRGKPLPPSPIPPEVEDVNPLGPPVPRGQPRALYPVPPSRTPLVEAPPPGQSAAGIRFTRDTGRNNGISWAPPDPSTAAASRERVVVQTANTYLQVSTDDGVTFTDVDPTTIFEQADGGMCCDQVVLYDPVHDLMFWLMQYYPDAGGANRLRVAWASPGSMRSNIRAWTYVDLTSSLFRSGAALDYPDLALSTGFLSVSVDGADASGMVGGLVVARLSLADIAGAGSSVGGAYLGPNESTDQRTAVGSHLAQNSAGAAYWAGHVDSSKLKVFRWVDGSGTVDLHDTPVNSWCSDTADYANLTPDGVQWPDTGHLGGVGQIVGVTRKPGAAGGPGQVWFGWGAGRDCASAGQGRPMPFVKIAQVDETTLDSVGEYHIWNTPYAFSYPALATEPSGEVGVAVAFGGPSDYPSSTVGYLGDYVVYFVEPSDVTLKFYTRSDNTFTFDATDPTVYRDSAGNPAVYTRYGDFFSVRNSGLDGRLLSSQGYAVRLVDPARATSCLESPGCTYHMHYEQWGRPARR